MPLFENDAAWDAWSEIEEDGIRYLRGAIAEAKKLARHGELDREPANAMLAIAAVILAKHGHLPHELRSENRPDDAIAAIPSKISLKLLNDLIWLVEKVRTQSEVQEFWKEEGLEEEWSRKVEELLKRLHAVTSLASRSRSPARSRSR